tara:strand:- start:234 stop:788 length:555 start_codon:yes stop_codon:yes gene_type:complete
MAQTLSTDIAAELNITARRNDTFKFELQVLKPGSSTASLDMVLGQDDGSGGTTTDNIYQAKMSIVDPSTRDVKLNIYSARWSGSNTEAGTDGNSDEPSATTAGHYYGASSGTTNVGGGIDVSNMDGEEVEDRLKISVPHNYMVFEPGEYKYDLQIRYRATSTSTPEYTTWLFGKFTLTSDITQL